MPVTCAGDVAFIIQRRDKAVRVDITFVSRCPARFWRSTIRACALQMDGGAFVLMTLLSSVVAAIA